MNRGGDTKLCCNRIDGDEVKYEEGRKIKIWEDGDGVENIYEWMM